MKPTARRSRGPPPRLAPVHHPLLLASLSSPLEDTRHALQLQGAARAGLPLDGSGWTHDVVAALSPDPATEDEEEAKVDEAVLLASLFGPLGPRGTVAALGVGMAVFVYCAVVSKVLPPTGYWLLDAVRDDRYYCYLVPLIVPVTVYHVIWNWFGIKLFKHN
ncbi:hypothetical protein H9P43_003008 [Blastocladiella emersonii ATCC 22665]|nr:hypothetical protein H9P43_003008 [Blastocladiella emersonii ATCC 22665]